MPIKRSKIRIPKILQPPKSIDLYTISKVYLVIGKENTPFAGQTLAVCSSKEKAEEAIKISYGSEEMAIIEVPLNSLYVDDEIVSV